MFFTLTRSIPRRSVAFWGISVKGEHQKVKIYILTKKKQISISVGNQSTFWNNTHTHARTVIKTLENSPKKEEKSVKANEIVEKTATIRADNRFREHYIK